MNAALVANPALLAQPGDLEEEEAYVPLYARGMEKKPEGVKADNFSTQLGDLTGQDKFFKRAMGGPIEFLSVNGADLTQRSLAEELQAQYEEKGPHKSEIKVAAKFWNSRTGSEVQTNEIEQVHKRKHHINTLAVNAAAIEIEMMRQRQQGAAKKTLARQKYGW